MAKKSTQDMGQYVKKETLYMVSLLALAIGFFGGVMFGIFKSGPSGPAQPAASIQPTPMPQSGADLSNKIAEFEREVAANPSNVTAWINLGNNYFDTNQYDKSIEAYKKALALAPNNANVPEWAALHHKQELGAAGPGPPQVEGWNEPPLRQVASQLDSRGFGRGSALRSRFGVVPEMRRARFVYPVVNLASGGGRRSDQGE